MRLLYVIDQWNVSDNTKLFFFLLWFGTHQGFRRGTSGAVDLPELNWSLKMDGGRGGGSGRPSSVSLSRPAYLRCVLDRWLFSHRTFHWWPPSSPPSMLNCCLLECETGSALQSGVSVVLSWSVSSHHTPLPLLLALWSWSWKFQMFQCGPATYSSAPFTNHFKGHPLKENLTLTMWPFFWTWARNAKEKCFPFLRDFYFLNKCVTQEEHVATPFCSTLCKVARPIIIFPSNVCA